MPTQKKEQAANDNALHQRLSDRALLMNQILNVEQNHYKETAGKDYLDYHNALKELNGLMDKHSFVEDESGLPNVLENSGKQALMNAIKETARTGERFLSSLRNDGTEISRTDGIPGIVTRLQNMLFDDYEVLSAYNPEEAGLSFPELQENARTQIVDLRGMDLKKMSGAQSSRFAMTVVDEKGRRRQGFFTKASYVNTKASFDKILQRVNSEYDKQSFEYQAEDFAEALVENGYQPKGKNNAEDLTDAEVVQGMKNQVNDLIPRFRKYLIEHKEMIRDIKPEDASEEMLIGHLGYKIGFHNQKKTKELLNDMGYSSDSMSNMAFSILQKGLNYFSNSVSDIINTRALLLKEGDRIDQRNTAMSAVASLLGVPELVARAENMKYLDEDGNVQEGTFMEFAKGFDLYSRGGEENMRYICNEPFGPPAGIIKSLADLQILDYICGNVDRHGANMTYIVDDNGVFQGVQAIDNDSSFGCCVPGQQKVYNKLGGTDSLRVMSQSMATKVRSLSPDMLRFALRGRGLNEEELGAACHRLTDLQDALLNRSKVAVKSEDVYFAGTKLCVMEDEALKSLNLKSVMNISPNSIRSVVEKFKDYYAIERSNHPYDPYAEPPERNPLTEVSTTDRRYVAGGIADSMQSMSRAIRNSVTGFKVGSLSSFLRSSDQFRSMVRAVKNAKETAKRIQKEIGADKEHLDRFDERVREQRDKADQAMQKVRQAAEIYLQKKMRERGADSLDALKGKNPYENRRIEYARSLLKEVAEYEALNNPQNEEIKEDRTKAVERAHRAGLRKPKPGNPKSGGRGI